MLNRMLPLMAVFALLAAISASAAYWCYSRGYVLYDGDAEAHLNIARRILDSRTPGPEQLGTVWLPLPHVLTIPPASADGRWQTGLAGAIVSPVCFLLAGTFLFAAARRAYSSATAALAVVLMFALNPNLLYLQSTPMTEALFLAALAALLWATLWFRDSQSIFAVLAAGVASNAASLTRYEGWFLIPFVALYLLVSAKRKWHAFLFGAFASLAPLAWLAHNRFYYSNALEFYNGSWSAMAIYHRQLASGLQPYPGDHDWRAALEYYAVAGRLVGGWTLAGIGLAGAVAAMWKRLWWPLILLLLAPGFYVWSIYSSGTPLYVPVLWPHSYYNTRYAIAMLPLAAFAGGALVTLAPARLRFAAAVFLAVISAAVWTFEVPVCWKEAEVNSGIRRAWTREAADFLAANYRPGSGILFSFGDLTGVLREAGIPLREGLHSGNVLEWTIAIARPDLFLHEGWALAFEGDEAATAVLRTRHYLLRKRILVKGAPAVEIYERDE
jgi:hypothetical protein